jgi:dihydroxyacetone kinase-like protein
MDTITRSGLVQLFAAWSRVMAAQKEALIALDGVMGDGDLGLTMANAFAAGAADVAASADPDPAAVLMRAGMAMAKAAPSTMGTLVATGFMRGGKALKGQADLDAPGLARFLRAFADGLMERGKAQPGEKTIIDTLHPAALAAEAKAALGAGLAETAAAAEAAAALGLDAATAMQARHGRAAYYQEKSIGKQDPGATVGFLIVKTLNEFLNGV